MKEMLFTLDAIVFVLGFTTLVVLGVFEAHRFQAILG
jgi:hypothetical protein